MYENNTFLVIIQLITFCLLKHPVFLGTKIFPHRFSIKYLSINDCSCFLYTKECLFCTQCISLKRYPNYDRNHFQQDVTKIPFYELFGIGVEYVLHSN